MFKTFLYGLPLYIILIFISWLFYIIMINEYWSVMLIILSVVMVYEIGILIKIIKENEINNN